MKNKLTKSNEFLILFPDKKNITEMVIEAVDQCPAIVAARLDICREIVIMRLIPIQNEGREDFFSES